VPARSEAGATVGRVDKSGLEWIPERYRGAGKAVNRESQRPARRSEIGLQTIPSSGERMASAIQPYTGRAGPSAIRGRRLLMSPIDPSLEGYMASVAAGVPPWEVPLADLRARHEADVSELWGRPPEPLAHVQDATVAGPGGPLSVRVYRPASESPLPALVWYHGGGWVIGSIASHDRLARALAAAVPCCLVSVDYRRAPENPFPAAADDAWAALLWTVDSADELAIDRERIAVGGDSAGGNLAAVTARRARDRDVRLALQVLTYPVTDSDFESRSYSQYGEGLNLTRDEMRWFWDTYLAGGDPTHPDAAPMRVDDLAGVAPALVQIAEFDVLRSEGEAYAGRLTAAGVPTRLTRYAGMVHGFLQMPAQTPVAQLALDEIVALVGGSLVTIPD
jgi:acetyl esterase